MISNLEETINEGMDKQVSKYFKKANDESTEDEISENINLTKRQKKTLRKKIKIDKISIEEFRPVKVSSIIPKSKGEKENKMLKTSNNLINQ